MKEKLKNILGSSRFWILTVGFLSQVVKLYFPEHEVIFNYITTWLLSVAGIGTIDRFAEKVSQSK